MDEFFLVEQCKKQNAKAERYLFEKYSPMLRGVCYRYAFCSDDAEDLLQEGFIKIFNTIHTFNWKGKGSLTAWMRRVMVNNAINYIKKNKRFEYVIVDEKVSDSFDIDEHDEEPFGYNSVLASEITQETLLALLHELPEIYKIVFNLSVIDELRHKEIAKILEIDESSSRSRLLRAKKILQTKIQEYCEKQRVEFFQPQTSK